MKLKTKRRLNKLLLSILAAIFLITSAAATHIHESYLFSSVGSNSVFITSPEGAEVQGSATGFEVKAPSGKVYTLTNAHVCGLQKDGIVMVGEKRNSGRLIPKRVIEVYTENDLCLVEGLEGYEGLSLADSYSIGDLNYTTGYPLGEALNFSSGYLKELGEVEILAEVDLSECHGKNLKIEHIQDLFGHFDVCVVIRRSVQTNIVIYPGNSGSPMVNAFGHVTGVIFAANNRTAWGSAVPLDDVKEFLKPY